MAIALAVVGYVTIGLLTYMALMKLDNDITREERPALMFCCTFCWPVILIVLAASPICTLWNYLANYIADKVTGTKGP